MWAPFWAHSNHHDLFGVVKGLGGVQTMYISICHPTYFVERLIGRFKEGVFWVGIGVIAKRYGV